MDHGSSLIYVIDVYAYIFFIFLVLHIICHTCYFSVLLSNHALKTHV